MNRLWCCLVASCLEATALVELVGEPAAEKEGPAARPDWKVAKTEALPGLRVSLSTPVLVYRSREYCWFPTLTRLANGPLLAKMSNYPDAHMMDGPNFVSWSDDGGLTWSEPIRGIYSCNEVFRPHGDLLLLPYYMKSQPDGSMRGTAQVIPQGKREIQRIEGGVTVSGWPRPTGDISSNVATQGFAGFVFNGQSVPLKDGGFLTTLYGYFQDTQRYSLVVAASQDGFQWTIRGIVADDQCPVPGTEGPCESALGRLPDGRLMCVFRVQSGVSFGQAWSSDEGRTWTEAITLPHGPTAEPSLVVLPDGLVALAGGRPGLGLYFNLDGRGTDWQRVDIGANHNACFPNEPVSSSSSYTEVVALDDRNLLYIYDRIPHGWEAIPQDSPETNSVWVVRIGVERVTSDE